MSATSAVVDENIAGSDGPTTPKMPKFELKMICPILGNKAL